MKTDIHPTNYRPVVFEDLNNGQRFLTKSTAPSEETTKWDDGQDYPLIKVHISSASHPFYTGQEKLIDVEGRVDKFKARQEFAAAAQKRRLDTSQPAAGAQAQAKPKPQAKPKAEPEVEVKPKPTKTASKSTPAKSEPAEGES